MFFTTGILLASLTGTTILIISTLQKRYESLANSGSRDMRSWRHARDYRRSLSHRPRIHLPSCMLSQTPGSQDPLAQPDQTSCRAMRRFWSHRHGHIAFPRPSEIMDDRWRAKNVFINDVRGEVLEIYIQPIGEGTSMYKTDKSKKKNTSFYSMM